MIVDIEQPATDAAGGATVGTADGHDQPQRFPATSAAVDDAESVSLAGSNATETKGGWRKEAAVPSLPETYQTVGVAPETAEWWRKLRSFTGLGFLVAVGYMDPGNWATDVAGGSQFGYDLLVVILCASLAAMMLQFLSVKLGVATGRDLAQACRDSFHPKVVIVLWLIMEIAMIATDMAELLGAAIALNLLIGLPLPAGVVIMGLDVMLILVLQQQRLRLLEAIIMTLTAIIFISLVYVVALSKPNWGNVFYGFIPKGQIFTNPKELFLGIGILGATVMPHNLFLHSSLVQSRKYPRTLVGKQYAVKYATLDSTLSLFLAFFINAFILIIAAAAFHGNYSDTEDIFQAYDRLTTTLGTSSAVMFAIALLASGQQASLTGTLAGQIVMEGMLDIKISAWKRRFVTRLIAIAPTVIVTTVMGQRAIVLLIISQVILSVSLSFVTFPLLFFTNSEKKMGKHFVNSLCTKIAASFVVFVIAGFNMYLIATSGSLELE